MDDELRMLLVLHSAITFSIIITEKYCHHRRSMLPLDQANVNPLLQS